MSAPMGLRASRPGPVTINPANAALVRLRKDAAARPDLPMLYHVERMHDFLWRQSSAYSYKLYGYYENHHAFRVLNRYLRLAYAAERAERESR